MSLMLLLVSSLLVVYINENSQCSSILGHVFLIMEDPIYSALEKLHFKRGASPFSSAVRSVNHRVQTLSFLLAWWLLFAVPSEVAC